MADEKVDAGSAQDWLSAYPASGAWGDLYASAAAPVADKWRSVAGGLAALAQHGGASLDEQVARQIADLGLTFRITGDTDERSWPLTPMPLVIGAQEWSSVEKGLVQRATLLEKVVADAYGSQSLVREGNLPAAAVAGSPFFARKMMGVGPKSGHYLHIYAADLARGPNGEWRVLSDRVRLATGIGYALENRMAMARMTDLLLSEIHARRLAGFFKDLREGLARDCQRERPRIALMTPGRFNQTYSEQAHLARYLGLPLVEGRDLVIDGDRLYVRTIAGPKRVDGLWRWVNTNSLDPLTFDSGSELGVANLFDAWARGGLEMANWPGVEVLESPALSAFLPRLCRKLMGEEPILPNIATWWCGQAAEADAVMKRLNELTVRPAFGRPVEALEGVAPVPGIDLGAEERAALADAMRRRPMDYVGQEIVHLSTTPALIDGTLQPRPFTLRAFVARTGSGDWRVMPGGFARLSASDALPNSLMGEGELSADVCIVDDAPPVRQSPTVLESDAQVTRGGGILASQSADNLFWFGRYLERAEMSVRIVRSILGSTIEVDGNYARDPQLRRSLVALLADWGAVRRDAVDMPFPQACAAALREDNLPGGVASLLARTHEVGLVLRERLSRDFWAIAKRPMPHVDGSRPAAMLNATRTLLERFASLSGLICENMTRGPAQRFLDMGRRIERALATCRIASRLTQANDLDDALGILLDLTDSQIVYRSRYLTVPLRDPVLDLVLLDPDNPRSLAFQLGELVAHLVALPQLGAETLPEEPLRQARGALAPLQTTTAGQVGPQTLQDLEGRLTALSEAISTRYFLQFEKPELQVRSGLLS
ncbi:circularly permuted type 2 ATP-grasp protein [Novosphingobium marinum]|uniref:circularly permuted type 2 ATP-grasp protein n=1 Tax=Novosphingobium marinum TaxID=1514948 RepID=UPI0015C74618|nr:circularly permuted type 2 ATP-grasp protein [Novosphingobium marinum]